MMKDLRVLMVEDSEDDAQLVERTLRRGGFDVSCQRVDTAAAMQTTLGQNTWDVVLADYSMPQFSGPAALNILKNSGMDIPFLIVSGNVGEEKAVELMRAGASDYILKDNLSRLVPAIERELREAQGRQERRLLEEQFRHTQKMEALGQLAGGVAHDFNNLLTIINGFTELLLMRLSPEDPSRGFLEQIKKAGDRSASLARQLLIFSRKQVVSPALIDLNVIITEAEKMLNRTIGENIALATDLGSDLHKFTADPGQVEQVIFNIVINARDAMPDGGQVTIRTRNVALGEGTARPLPDMPLGNYVLLEIRDKGTGMSPEVLNHIFEPFYTTKDPGKGTGLGLATVFGIVKQSGGHIAVDSKPGAGTAFRIFFPEAVTPVAGAGSIHSANVEVPSKGNEVVLVAEDEENVRMLLNQVLVKNGYTVLEAKNGKEAFLLASKFGGEIHILLTDVVMPEMGGLELTRQLREIHPETRVLLVSGYPSDPTVRQEIQDGEIEFLPKPWSAAALTAKIRMILDSPKQRRAAPPGVGAAQP